MGWNSATPHSPQKLASGGFSEPHFGQWGLSVAPQRMQNFLPAAFSKSQLKQRIDVRRNKMTYSPLVSRSRLKGHLRKPSF